MLKPNKFIKKFILENARKGNSIVVTDAGKRFTIDGNAHSISLTTAPDNYQYGVIIVKEHGKYAINEWYYNSETGNTKHSIYVTSKDAVIEKLINKELEYAIACTVKDKHLNSLGWKVIRDAADLYDDEMLMDIYGALPDGFEPVSDKLPAPPAEINIDL